MNLSCENFLISAVIEPGGPKSSFIGDLGNLDKGPDIRYYIKVRGAYPYPTA